MQNTHSDKGMDRNGSRDHRSTTALGNVLQLSHDFGTCAPLGESNDRRKLRFKECCFFLRLYMQEHWGDDL